MGDDHPQWRSMDAEARAAAYSPSTALPDGDLKPHIRAYIDQSAAAYAAFPETQTLTYGPKPSNTVDIVVPKAAQPVALHVFIHGGYWQELSKRESFMPAPDTVARSMAFAAIDYTLAPNAGMDDIVAECVSALTMLLDKAAGLGIDPTRIVVSGSSAGAHLAAMSCLQLPRNKRPKALILMSGIYELEPLIGTYINDALGMDTDCAQRNSPALADLTDFPPTVVTWGAQETSEFKRQSKHFANLLGSAGCNTQVFEMAGRNHFDIVEDISNDSDLGRALAAFVISEGS